MSDTPNQAPDTHVRPRWLKVSLIVAIALIAILVVILLIAGGHGPGRHGAIAESPTEEAISRVGGRADASDADRTIEVMALDTMAFEPSSIEVAAGETITFVVTNAGEQVHEFTLGDSEMQQEHAESMEHMPAGMAHDRPNSITLQAGETKQLTWRFGDAALEFVCHRPGHYEAGMHGRITLA
jgi:uncharacterized cupredoxin-like copper-binding protein